MAVSGMLGHKLNPSPSLAELEPICQKPNFRTHGNWVARRVARPLALYVTRWLLPLGVRAHWVTLVALVPDEGS